ncbi:MAG: ROK family transcriptional regulator [Actinomycetota bacterium]|nr:ROK family transcriptional regulator [Actinomycetota bacterium]
MSTPDRPPADTVQAFNRERVLTALHAGQAVNRAELGRVTGLARSTVTRIVGDLLGDGVIVERPAPNPSVPRGAGRPAVLLALAPRTDLVVAIDFGHSHCRVGVADSSAAIIAESSIVLDVDASADRALRHATANVVELLDRLGSRRTQVIGAAIGIPAPLDLATGAVGSGSILPGWINRRPAEELQRALKLPVVIDNDANLGALGEARFGAARGYADVIYVKVSTGIGAGLILDGHVYRGSTGRAGEIGHVPVDPNGALCRCGNRGCLETVAAVGPVLNLVQPGHGGHLTLDALVRMTQAGNPGVIRVLDDTGRTLGRVLADMVNSMNPAALIIGGEFSLAGKPFLAGVRESLHRFAQPDIVRSLHVSTAQLGDRAELLGAAALALERLGVGHQSEPSRGRVG